VHLPFFDEESIANEPEFMQPTESDDEVNLLKNIDPALTKSKVKQAQGRKHSYQGLSSLRSAFKLGNLSQGSFGPHEEETKKIARQDLVKR
jgi:hypothetical protein